MSYAAEVIADTSGNYAGNSLRFDTETEASDYVADLSRRWTLVTATRIVRSDDPVNRRIIDGVIYPLCSSCGGVGGRMRGNDPQTCDTCEGTGVRGLV